MNVVRENQKDLTTLLRVTVTAEDYNPAVEKALRTYKRKANVPGFRPGMVPMGIINKMYRKGVVAEEAYRAASGACFDFIEKEQIDFIGDMMPSEEQQPLDFDVETPYEFVFELGLTPAVNLDLSAKDKVTKYSINVDDKMREGYRANFLRRFGKLVDVEVVEGEEAINVTLDQEEMQIEEAYVGLIGMTEEERKPFIGKKVGDSMDVDVNELYKNPAQRASILSVTEEELATINPKFKLTITKLRKFAEPELNEEFFKMAFPEGNVTTAEEFEKYIDAQVSKDLERETEYMFTLDMRNFLMKKAELVLPEAFLKRWLYTINEGKFTMEEIEKDFDQFLEMMKWNIIQKHYVKSRSLEVTSEELITEAKGLALMQFAQYGMSQVADDMLENYAKSILGNKEEARKIQEKLYERKVVESLTPDVTISNKAISAEEFGKLVEKLQ